MCCFAWQPKLKIPSTQIENEMEKKKLVNRIYRTEKEEWHTEIKKYEEREKRRKKKKPHFYDSICN